MFITPLGPEATNLGKMTYSAVSTAFTPGATPQDIFTITGSATKVIRVLRMGISTTQTTAGINNFFLAKRSSANTAGTSAAPAITVNDSLNTAATATVLQYTANPTAGTLVGYISGFQLNSPAPATAGIGGLQGIDYSLIDTFGQPITLRGITEVLAWNFKGAALPGGLSVIAYCQWTEE